jgi:hypothetical protein
MKNKKDDFIKKVNLIHNNKYDYSNVDFINIKTNVNIICPIHGEFNQRPQHHLAGHGCKKCARELITNNSKLTKESFINKAFNKHGSNYDYSLIDFNSVNSNNDKVKIICTKHGEFNQIIRHHLSGVGCPFCNESKGEKQINTYLTTKNIRLIRQHRFNDCRDIKPLPFDFYLPEYNICIEYDGEQHFTPLKMWGGVKSFEKLQKRDLIKTTYCLDKNIRLIIIFLLILI